VDGPTGNATAAALDVPSHRVGRKALAHVIADDFPRPFARDVTITFHGVYVEGDRVIVEETMSATPASGKAYVNDYCCVFELHGGLIHRVREYGHRTGAPHGVRRGPVTSGYRAAGMTACLMISGTTATTARHVYLRHRSSKR
jgi:hypothetical protein